MRTTLTTGLMVLPAMIPALVLTDMIPAAGAPGITVRLVATEPVEGTFAVRLGEAGTAVPATTDGAALVITVPAGAATGEVQVARDGGDFVGTGLVFRVARTVTVRLTVPNAAPFAAHDVGSTIGDATPAGAGAWALPVAQGETALVVATAADEAAPQLMAFATDSMSEVALGGHSTATAMIFLAPGVYIADPAAADERLASIGALAGVIEAAAVIDGHLAQGRDFLADARYEAALVAAMTEYGNLLAAEIDGQLGETAGGKFVEDSVSDVHGFAAGSPRDLPGAINVLRVAALPPGRDANNVPVVRFGLEGRPLGVLGKKINSLDWIAHAWPLDAAQFTGGIAAVNALTAAEAESRVYTRLGTRPVSSLSIKATNVLKNLNLIDVASDVLLGFAPAFPPPDGLEFPADRAGVYMVRTYSGAVYPALDPLISALPEGGDEDALMKGINVVLAAVEFASIVLPVKDVLGSEVLAKVIWRASREAMAAITREGNESGGLTAEFFLTVFLEVSKGITKQLLAVGAEQGLKAIPRLGKSVAKFLNVLGKAAAVGASVERLAALTNASRLISDRAFFAPSVESTVVVVGDPFAPEVIEIAPRQAHRGEVIRLIGRRFHDGRPGDHIVQFGGLSTDPYATTGAGRVLFASGDTLLVEVPEAAVSGPITVAIVERGVANSVRIADGQGHFTVLPDPVILAIDPPTGFPGGMVEIVGEHFSRVREGNRVEFSGSFNTNLVVLHHSETSLLVQVPIDAASGKVTVRAGGRPSNAFPFSINVTPPTETATILVGSTADNTAADGQMTLREAILVARGELGRALTSPPEERPTGVSYETDFVLGRPGPGVRNRIEVQFGEESLTLTLGAPLPTPQFFTELRLAAFGGRELTIDGAAVAGDALVFEDADSVEVQGGIFRRFSGNGATFKGTTRRTVLRDVTFRELGGHGIVLQEQAQHNTLHAVEVEGAALDGVLLEGPEVRFNVMTRPGISGPDVRIGAINHCGGWGVLIRGGARHNWLAFGDVRSNSAGGVRVMADSPFNLLGRADSSIGIFPRVFNNGGPGVLVEAGHTAVRYLNVGRNLGDGILFQGNQARDGQIDVVRVGYEFDTGDAAPNEGHGIHIRNGAGAILIGRAALSSFGARNAVAGNRDDGIRVDGAGGGGDRVTIAHTHVGLAIAGSTTEVPQGNGRHGIALHDARDCLVGDFELGLDVHVNDHQNGAGVMLTGTRATRNRLINCQIGSHHDGRAGIGNGIGIQISDGAWGNLIGQRSSPHVHFAGGQSFDGKGGNVIMANTVAGVVIESGGNPAVTQGPTDPPTGGNVVVANRIGGPADFAPVYLPNEVGVLLRRDARHNRIGGPEPGDGNLFARNKRAGLQIAGITVTPGSANRILGNDFLEQGLGQPPAGDPLAGPPDGVGVLVTDGAKGHLIGSSDPAAGNRFAANRVGVYIDDSEAITVAGNRFAPSQGLGGNELAGVILRGSRTCACGPNNVFHANGNGDLDLGAIVVVGGQLNRVWGNEIGSDAPAHPVALGNNTHGITIIDSRVNHIGGPQGAGNTIVNNAGAGVVLRGVGASGNRVLGNLIGVAGVAALNPHPNQGGGVLIEDGAFDNRIGAEEDIVRGGSLVRVPVGNRIVGNGGDGVLLLSGTGNTIRFNQISGHDTNPPDKGIHLVGAANDAIPKPVIEMFRRGRVSGTVESAAVPDGSIVDLFSDPGDEGLVWIGETTVREGKWAADVGLLPYLNVTATVTHVTRGSTSEFATLVRVDSLAALRLRRWEPTVPADRPLVINRRAALHDIALETGELDVNVRRLVVRLTPDSEVPGTDGALWLLHDIDRDGGVGPGDPILSSEGLFDAEQNGWVFDDLGAIVPADSEERWLVVGVVTSLDGAAGRRLQFSVEAEADVDARLVIPSTSLQAMGPFPVAADRFALVEATPGGAWILF